LSELLIYMFNKNLFALFIVCSILLFGCTGQSNQDNEQAQEPTQQNQDAGIGTQNQGTNQDQNTNQQNNQNQQALDLEGKVYTELVALGVPLECDISTTLESGSSMNMKMYLQGEDNIYMEYSMSDTSESACDKYVIIMTGGVMYIGCDGEPVLPDINCVWMEYALDETDSSGAGASSSINSDMENIPSTDMTCKPWVYDASKFSVQGESCTIEEITERMTVYYDQ